MKLEKIRQKLTKLVHKYEKKSKVQPDKLATLEEKLLQKQADYKEKLKGRLSDNKRKSLETKLKVTRAQLNKVNRLAEEYTEAESD